MPLYEYQCQSCHRRVEKIQLYSAEPLRVCESCGGELEKLISAPAFQFKGSGWYATDYAKKSGSSASSSSDNKDAAESKPETKTDSAADAKPAAAPASSDK
ncbi:MAG: FmdB family zinc ribbon protein [Terriglobales bacterium]